MFFINFSKAVQFFCPLSFYPVKKLQFSPTLNQKVVLYPGNMAMCPPKQLASEGLSLGFVAG